MSHLTNVLKKTLKLKTKNQIPPRLENSQILKNLDQKLSLLRTTETEQLKDLVYKNKYLFPNIPTWTNKIFNDVDVGDALSVKQYPYQMNLFKKEYL